MVAQMLKISKLETENAALKAAIASIRAKNGALVTENASLRADAATQGVDDKVISSARDFAAKFFLAAGEAKEKYGDKPLVASSESGDEWTAIGLLSSGYKDIEEKNQDGKTSLVIAVEKGYSIIAKSLIDSGADLNARGNENKSPLHAACDKGYDVIAKSLIDAGANMHTRDVNGTFPLLTACEKGYEVIVKSLIDAGADVKMQGSWGYVSFYWAVLKDHRYIMELLHAAESSGDPKACSLETSINACWTALACVAKMRHSHFYTSLVTAAAKGDEGAVRGLLVRGGDNLIGVYKNLDEQDGNRDTALIFSAVQGHEHIVKALLAAGANKDLQNNVSSR